MAAPNRRQRMALAFGKLQRSQSPEAVGTPYLVVTCLPAQVFTNFLLTHVPDVTQTQIGALWWRADTNGDGQDGKVTLQAKLLPPKASVDAGGFAGIQRLLLQVCRGWSAVRATCEPYFSMLFSRRRDAALVKKRPQWRRDATGTGMSLCRPNKIAQIVQYNIVQYSIV